MKNLNRFVAIALISGSLAVASQPNSKMVYPIRPAGMNPWAVQATLSVTFLGIMGQIGSCLASLL